MLDRAGASHHARVRDLPDWLRPGDLLVVNETRVLPARLRGRKETGGAAEALLLGEPTPGRSGHPALLRTRDTIVAENGGTRVCVGYDGRISSPDLETALVEGLTLCGVNVIRVGLGPTPMLYYAVNKLSADGGIMISGSHNPPEFNGFKMMIGTKSFFGADIQRLGVIAESGVFASSVTVT